MHRFVEQVPNLVATLLMLDEEKARERTLDAYTKKKISSELHSRLNSLITNYYNSPERALDGKSTIPTPLKHILTDFQAGMKTKEETAARLDRYYDQFFEETLDNLPTWTKWSQISRRFQGL